MTAIVPAVDQVADPAAGQVAVAAGVIECFKIRSALIGSSIIFPQPVALCPSGCFISDPKMQREGEHD